MGLTLINNGGDFEVNQLFGSSNTLVSNLEYNYYGGDSPHFSVDRMGTTTGQVLFTCENGHGRMIQYEGPFHKAISSSILLGALNDGAGMSIKSYLVAEIVNYFLRITVNPVTPGDSNCDGIVNLLDVIATLNHILSQNPQPFCFGNADINADNVANVIDVIAAINIILGKKSEAIPGLTSNAAQIMIHENSIDFFSDGTVAGIQFEIAGAIPSQLELLPGGFEFMSNMVDGKLTGIVFSFDNTPFPAGKINLFRTRNSSGWRWGEIIGANVNAREIKIQKHQPDGTIGSEPLLVSVFPNPAKNIINIDANQKLESIRIFDQLGQIVQESQVRTIKTTLNVTHLKRGVYVLEVKTPENVSYRKIVIE